MLVMLFSSLGIAVCIGMASTFAFANSALKHQVSLRVISNYYGDYSTNNFNITQFPALGVFSVKIFTFIYTVDLQYPYTFWNVYLKLSSVVCVL